MTVNFNVWDYLENMKLRTDETADSFESSTILEWEEELAV